MDDFLFHEKQQGSLCAQHCLNTLLQGEYFTPVDLAHIAEQMDEEEREKMAEGGKNSEEYRKFIQGPSNNMDDSGFFSVQVLQKALNVWNLEMIPFNSKDALATEMQKNPCEAQAYICNYYEHWFTIRKFGAQWFNLNSLLTKPEPISNTYLSLYLKQLQTEGYSIFIVSGTFPQSVADQLSSNVNSSSNDSVIDSSKRDENLQSVIENSLRETLDDEKRQLELALKMSMECATPAKDSQS